MTALEILDSAAIDVGLQRFLDLIKCLSVQDRLVLTLEPFAAIMDLAEIDPVLQEIGEGTVGEGNAALVFCDLDVSPCGDDTSSVEFSDELGERFQLQV